MKKVLTFSAMIVFEIGLAFSYGLWLQHTITVEYAVLFALFVPLIVLTIVSRASIKRIDVLLMSVLLTAVFITVFSCGNRISLNYVEEYETVVQYVNYKGGGFIKFTTPNGSAGNADLHNYRIVIDDDDFIQVGDKVVIREYSGWFGRPYYVFVQKYNNDKYSTKCSTFTSCASIKYVV